MKAKIFEWQETKEIKSQLKSIRREMDDFIRQHTGLQPALQLPGNYRREILSQENENLVPDFVGDEHPHEKNH